MGENAAIGRDGAFPLVDWEVARRKIPGGERGLMDLAALMRSECTRLLDEAEAGLAAADATRVFTAVHTILGGALHFGATQVAEGATEIQALAKAEALEQVRDRFAAFDTLVRLFAAELAEVGGGG